MKTPKRKSVRAENALDTRLSARVSEEAYQRLFVASVMGKSTAGEILDRLIRDHCREWSLPGKVSERSAKHDRVIPAEQVNQMPLESAA